MRDTTRILLGYHWDSVENTLGYYHWDTIEGYLGILLDTIRISLVSSLLQSVAAVKATIGTTPTSAAGAPKEEVGTKVKSIMNQAYQMMVAKFKTKDSYQSKEILTIIVGVVKVRSPSPLLLLQQ